MTQPPANPPHMMEALDRDRAEQRARAERQQTTLDQLVDLVAKQSDDLRAIRKMLRRREAQLAKAQAEVKRLRRRLGLEDPDPEPDGPEPSPSDEPSEDDPDDPESVPGGPSPRDPSPPQKPGPKPKALDGDQPEDAPPPGGGTKPKAPRVGGRQPPPAHLPTDREHHSVCACERCGGRVLRRDVEQTPVYSAVQSYVRRRLIFRDRVVCANPSCGVTTTAPMPPMPCNRALYDCSFIAMLVTLKFGYMLPLDRIQAMLESQDVRISMGTLVHLMERATELADAVDGEHMKQLKAGKYVCFDGTGLKVLMPGQNTAWHGYLEVYTRDELTVFQFDLTKHADELRARLESIDAMLVTDAESRNKAGAPGATFAHCNAHVVRAFRDAERSQPILACEGRAFLKDMYDIERAAQAAGLKGERLREERQACRPILERFQKWLNKIDNGDLPPTDPVRKVARYYLRHWDGLTRFVDDPDLPIDNNAAEREFQRHAKLRLASLFAGSVEGAHRWATLLGVVRTAQKLGLDVQAYLTWMFERRGTHKARFGLKAKQLTPAAYKAAGCPGAVVARLQAGVIAA